MATRIPKTAIPVTAALKKAQLAGAVPPSLTAPARLVPVGSTGAVTVHLTDGAMVKCDNAEYLDDAAMVEATIGLQKVQYPTSQVLAIIA